MTNVVNLTQEDGAATLELSAVVPCFDEELVIEALFSRLSKACADAVGQSYEIILIDDGSRDSTWTLISELAENDSKVTAIKLSRNFGHQLALSAGLSYVNGKQILAIDADLQDPPELLGEMRALMAAESADVVYGKRLKRHGESRFKIQSAHLFYRLLGRFTSIDIPENAGDFRLMTRRVAKWISNMPERDRFIRGMVSWVGYKQVAFVYERDRRYAGDTKYPFRRMLAFALDAFLGFSFVPLRIATYFAMALFVFLIGVSMYTLYSWAVYDVVAGWTSITILIVLTSAVQLMCLGIVGEYVGRIYLQDKRRPLYIVDAISSKNSVSKVQ
jgi:dolichol-phosphate mannosyltransferase